MSTPGAGHNQPPGRWIAIDVGMLEHPVVGWKQPMTPANPKMKAASRCEAWIDLIRFARWKAGATDNQGRIVYVERGELMASRSFLAERWNWTEKAVRHFMQRLEKEFMVTKTEPRLVAGSEACPKSGQQSGQASSPPKGQRMGQRSKNLNQHYRIENYDIYQVAREVDGMLRGQRDDTPGDQAADQHGGQRGASEGPESIPRRYQEDNNYTDARAREPEPQPVPENLMDQLCDAAGKAIANPAACPGLLLESDPIRWLQNGCSLKHDILPAIQARAAKAKPASIRSWSYFDQVVFEARDRRLAPAPDPVARGPSGPSDDWRDRIRSRQMAAKAYLNGGCDGQG